MVERFNRTLAAMLSAYVSENHRDWDEQLPYVTMAYRSTEHETTGMSPNMLMFGREVSTPLDLVYELPNLSKPIPSNQWVWELRDRIERAHTLVRQYTQQAMHWQICLIYLDDIIIFGKTFAEMIQNLDTVLARFAQAGLKLKSQKCQLFKREVNFLGHVINEHGIHTNPQKIECVKTWPTPKNITELRSFLGLCSYYRRFIANYSHVAKPLTRLTEKDQKFNWTSECSEAFGRLKHMLVTAPILAHPDFTKPFILDTDASNHAIGAVLSQKTGNEEHAFPPTGFSVAWLGRTLHLVAAVG